MPITQDRMIAVINAADSITVGLKGMRETILTVGQNQMDRIRHLARQEPRDEIESQYIKALRDCFVVLNTIVDRIKDEPISVEAQLTIGFERKHFEHKRASNDRAKMLQATSRGGTPKRTVRTADLKQKPIALSPDELDQVDADLVKRWADLKARDAAKSPEPIRQVLETPTATVEITRAEPTPYDPLEVNQPAFARPKRP